MIKKIMKMGGCKTEAEFYKKYPTEESFLEAFPQARPMMKQYKSGGSTDMAFPQAPTADRFFNYGPPTPNFPRLMQAGGENQNNEQAFMQIVSAVAQHNNVQPNEVLTNLQDNMEEEDLEQLTMASNSDPEAVLQMVNAYTQNYLGQNTESEYQYLEGQPYMQQMLDQQANAAETQEAPEEGYQMPVDPNQAMQMAYGGSKLRKFIPKHQTKGPVQKQQPPAEQDSFWDTGWGNLIEATGVGGAGGAMAYGMARAANSEMVRKALGYAEDVWASMKSGEKLKAMAKGLKKVSIPKTKSGKAALLTGVASAALYGAGEIFDWFGDSPQAVGTGQPQAAPKTGVLNTQPPAGAPADSFDAMRAPIMQPDTGSKIKNTTPGGVKSQPKQKTTTKDTYNFKQGGQKKKFQTGGLWDRFSNYMSNATPGDLWRDLNYNLDRGGNPSEWTTAPRQWIGYTEDPATGEILRYNEYGNEEERALAEYVKSQHEDLITRSATQSALAEVDPYMYSSRPEWLGGSPNWRQNLSYATSGLAEKFRTDYDSPRGMFDQPGKFISFENYRPSDYLDLGIGALTMAKNIPGYMMATMLPQMAQNIGDAPFKAQRTQSTYPYYSAVLNPLFLGRSGLMSDIALGAYDVNFDLFGPDTHTGRPEDYTHFYDWEDPTQSETQIPMQGETVMAERPVQNAPGFEVQPQTRAAAMSMQNKAMMKDWERQKNAPKRNPIGSFKKGGESAPMGTSSNEDVISKRLDKLKSYVEENVTGSMLKDEQEEIMNAFMQAPPMPQQQPVEGDYMQGGGSSGFMNFINPFDRRRVEATIPQGQPQANQSPIMQLMPMTGSFLQTIQDMNKSNKPEGWRPPMDPDYNPNAPTCPPGYKYDAQKGDCVIAQTRGGKALEAVGDAWKNADGQQLASGVLAGLGTISGAMERSNMRKQEKQLEQNIWERQMTSAGGTDKGKYLTNSGDFVPPTMQTPVQFTGYNPGVFAKKGAQVDGEVTYLTDDQIKHIISLGGQVEFLD